MLSEHDQGVYVGMISAACLLYERLEAPDA
jgi:hypothetical protein